MTTGQPVEATMPTGRQCERVLGVALLAGAVSSSSLARLIGRSALDLPLTEDGRTVGGQWLAAAEALAGGGGAGRVWVLVDDGSPAPVEASGLEVMRDRGGLRGAGGALRDLATQVDADGQILVIIGVHTLLAPLLPVVRMLAGTGAEIAMLGERPRPEPPRNGHRDECGQIATCSMMLASSAALRSLRSVGFLDLKEQGLNELRSRCDIRVVPQQQQVTASLRTREEYLGAVRALALRAAGRPDDAADPLAERWRPAFSIAAPGVHVPADVRLCDSVALEGARLGAGATIVRSVVAGPVAPGAMVVDAVIGPDGAAT